eukprot:TRINITY_DN4323_c0_g1_i1.p1 TRINITY_DN4323_c0_g1~~TRINITY_DN4323_c0_g1_i1.p1  ORF type:complete len:553 (-),score=213.39 TRINITY_DN4323_c0_g1_i1:36-1694(-)
MFFKSDILGNLRARRKNFAIFDNEQERELPITKSKIINQSFIPPKHVSRVSRIAFYIIFFVILFAAFKIRFRNIEFPDETVFDEVYFSSFAQFYVRNQYFFDIHPPMAKLTFAFIMHLSNFNTSFAYEYKHIGMKYPNDSKYIYIRYATATLSALTVVLAFLTCERLQYSLFSCVIAAAFILFDGCWHSMAVRILTDSFLWFFQALSIYCAVSFWLIEDESDEQFDTLIEKNERLANQYQVRYSKKWWFWCISTGLAMAHTCSVKWTGIGVIGAIGLRQIWRTFKSISPPHKPYRIRRVIAGIIAGCVMIGIIAVFYTGYWVIHFKVLTHTGPGDVFMTPRFRSTLIDSKVTLPVNEKPISLIGSILELHKTMFVLNSGLSAPHPYGTSWLSWLVMYRGVAFWTRYFSDQTRSIIVLLGNPLSWWTISAISAAFIGYLISIIYREESLSQREIWYSTNGGWLLIGFLANYVPYSRITRTCFLYHFMLPQYFLILLTPLAIEFAIKNIKIRTTIFSILLIASAWGWFNFNAIFYGDKITTAEWDSKMWVRSWI